LIKSSRRYDQFGDLANSLNFYKVTKL